MVVAVPYFSLFVHESVRSQNRAIFVLDFGLD